MKFYALIILTIIITTACDSNDQKEKKWMIGPFVKVDSVNPILTPSKDGEFFCPVTNKIIFWEAKDVFNPAALVRKEKVVLFYRAEDFKGKDNGTSRIGMAESTDGYHFIRNKKPILFPDNDSLNVYEWTGGIEDPRVVEDEKGNYYMTYSSFDGNVARLCLAKSCDLKNWEKLGPVFKNKINFSFDKIERDEKGMLTKKYVNNQRRKAYWNKSGAIVCNVKEGKNIAAKINSKYWMYWGDSNIFLASSDNLINWEILCNSKGDMIPVMKTRIGFFDSYLVEPGPPAIIVEQGILLIYNSKNDEKTGDPLIGKNAYCAGQALFSMDDPSNLIDRCDTSFLKPERPYEIEGQINQVCFVEGLVNFNEKWLIYYGTADSKIAVAECIIKK